MEKSQNIYSKRRIEQTRADLRLACQAYFHPTKGWIYGEDAAKERGVFEEFTADSPFVIKGYVTSRPLPTGQHATFDNSTT